MSPTVYLLIGWLGGAVSTGVLFAVLLRRKRG
jgi:hypothetical protein